DEEHTSSRIRLTSLLRLREVWSSVLGSVVSDLEFSAPPQRSLRLRGECFQADVHRRGAEATETTQRKTENHKGRFIRSGLCSSFQSSEKKLAQRTVISSVKVVF